MNNLKTLAAKDNLFLIDEIPAMYFENEYFAKNFERYKTKENYHIKQLPEFIQKSKSLESGLFYEISTQYVNNSDAVELYFIENVYWLVKHKDFEFYCMLTSSWSAKGKMFLQLPFSFYRQFHNISNDLKKQATKNIVEPNNIGTFTDKKIVDWFKYNAQFMDAYKSLKITVEAKNNDLQNEIDSFINALNGKCKVTKHNNITYVYTPIFNVVFELYANQNYLSKKIEFRGGLNDIIKITNL